MDGLRSGDWENIKPNQKERNSLLKFMVPDYIYIFICVLINLLCQENIYLFKNKISKRKIIKIKYINLSNSYNLWIR